MRVLLVEDDEMIGRSLKQALEGAGWSADWVRDGELAQSALGDGGYTCVLLDLGLPRQDGTEVLRRARERGDATPVLCSPRATAWTTASTASTWAPTTTC